MKDADSAIMVFVVALAIASVAAVFLIPHV